MRTTFRATMLVCLAASAVLFTGCGNDQKKIQGKWEITDADMGTTEEAKQMAKFASAIFKLAEIQIGDGTVTISASLPGKSEGKEEQKMTFTLAPDKSPKEFDLSGDKKSTSFNDKGEREEKTEKKTMKGIYKLDGDTLTIAVPMDDDGARPTKFEGAAPAKDDKGKEKGGVIVLTLKRKK